jgi:hypothetical protein
MTLVHSGEAGLPYYIRFFSTQRSDSRIWISQLLYVNFVPLVLLYHWWATQLQGDLVLQYKMNIRQSSDNPRPLYCFLCDLVVHSINKLSLDLNSIMTHSLQTQQRMMAVADTDVDAEIERLHWLETRDRPVLDHQVAAAA